MISIDPLILVLIGMAAVVYGVFVGRAKASRLRRVQREVRERNPLAIAILIVVAAVIVVVMLWSGASN